MKQEIVIRQFEETLNDQPANDLTCLFRRIGQFIKTCIHYGRKLPAPALWLMLILTNLLNCNIANGQAPQAIPYQAVARNNAGDIISNQNIALRCSILDGSNAGPVLYQETQTSTTNSLGLFTINLGQGTIVSGTFNAINWSMNSKYLKVELDAAGGNNFVTMGTTQLMSVPYALHANTSGDQQWVKNSTTIYNANAGNVGIGTSTPVAKLHTTGSVRHQTLAGNGSRMVMADMNGNLLTGVAPGVNGGTFSIPDNGCASGNGATSLIILSGLPTSVPTSTIKVRLNITHFYDADVAIFLIAPNGAILKLAENNGGSGDNFVNTVFSDNGSQFITSGVAPFTGTYKPLGTLTSTCSLTPTVSSFSAIGGGTINPNGSWLLKVFDDAQFDGGNLNTWYLELDGYTNSGVNNYLPKWENGVLTNTSSVYDNGTNVGIGTINPTAQLHTTGNVKHESLTGTGKRLVLADAAGLLSSPANGSAGYFPKWTSQGLSNSSLMYETIDGIGIDTTVTGGFKLNVNGKANFTGFIRVGNAAGLPIGGTQIPLVVGESNVSIGPGFVASYFGVGTGGLTQSTNATAPSASIMTYGSIWSDYLFISTSDKRIKNILSKTNNKEDLDVLNQIEITNYKYIDEVSHGDKLQKKVIAQQVKENYPLAVSTKEGVVPDVFEVALSSKTAGGQTIIETKKEHGFATGDEVKIILKKSGSKLVKVKVIDAHHFSIDEMIDEEIFVYGKMVNDLLTVDYDALTTLNISATQELSKQIEILRTENEKLKVQHAALLYSTNEKINSIEARLNSILRTNATTSAKKNIE